MSLPEPVAPSRRVLRLRPLSRAVTRPVSVLALVAWVATMAVLVNRSYVQASINLATDLSQYGATAQWRGVYYRGAKIGFTVRQVLPTVDGYQLEEDGQLEMTLLGASAAARIHTIAQVDDTFALRSFEFSLDPGTGPITVNRRVVGPDAANAQPGDGWRLIVGRDDRWRDPDRGARARGAASAGDQSRPAARERGVGPRRSARVDAVRPGHAQQPARRLAGRRARGRAGGEHAVASLSCGSGAVRAADHVVGDRHRRGRPRGEPTRGS